MSYQSTALRSSPNIQDVQIAYLRLTLSGSSPPLHVYTYRVLHINGTAAMGIVCLYGLFRRHCMIETPYNYFLHIFSGAMKASIWIGGRLRGGGLSHPTKLPSTASSKVMAEAGDTG